MPEPRHRPAQHQHRPHADGRRRPGGAVRPSGRAARARAGRVRALHARDEAQPGRPEVARPRPLRALGRPRVDAALREPAPLGLRRVGARPDQAVPPARLAHAGPSGELRDARASRRPPARSARASATRVGMAMAEKFLREKFGAEVCDHHIFAICSDGDLMEGVASEAASLAGHLRLGRCVFLYDDNEITIDGPTEPRVLDRGRRRSGSRPTAGTRSRSRTATTSTRSRPRSAPAWPRRSGRR